MDVRLDEEVADALVVQEVGAEAARQEAKSNYATGEGEDVSELFKDSEDKAEPTVETRATRPERATVVESSEFEPEEQL